MFIIDGKNIKKEINGVLLFEVKQIQIQSKQKIGLVGENGSGKSTLLQMLVGKDLDFTGNLIRKGDTHYMPQLIDIDSSKSGGEQIKAKLNQAFSQTYDLVLLDEPTTNLDYENIQFLQNRLKHLTSAVLIVSHDRTFLNEVCDITWEIIENKIETFPGKYFAYENFKNEQLQMQQKKYEKYKQTKMGLETAIENKRKTAAQVVNKKPKAKVETGLSKPFFAKKQKKVAKSAKVLEQRLNQLEKVIPVKQQQAIIIKPPQVKQLSNRILFRFNDFSLKMKHNILVEPFDAEIKFGEKIALIGKNGVGKTTLFKAIQADDSANLTIHPQVKIAYFSQNLSVLPPKQEILQTIMETSSQPEHLVRTILAQFGFLANDLTKKIEVLSGGEQVRIALIKLLVSDMNVLLLDEPTNYLDYNLLDTLEKLLQNYQGTILFISHDQAFIKKVAQKTWEIKDRKLISKAKELSKSPVQQEEELLKIELRLSAVISELSITPNEVLEKEYQALLNAKQKLKK